MWNETDDKLICDFNFDSFVEAFSFLNEVAILAERFNHHPAILNEYSRVRLELTTHDAGHVVTELDWKLAKAIDEINSGATQQIGS